MALTGSARTPDGVRLYAIGDIHGCLDDLRACHAWIAKDLSQRPPPDWRIIHLGDVVDRGPDTPGVVDLLRTRSTDDPRVLCLRGNHDQWMLDFLDDPMTQGFEPWVRYGGTETLTQYGVDHALLWDRLETWEAARQVIPADHTDYLSGLPLTLEFGDYLMVHAGIRPGVPIARQRASDLQWIRDDFLLSEVEHSHVVIHGHTVSSDIEKQNNRIGIDTGAVFGGVLSCLVLEGAHIARLSEEGPTPLP